MLLRKACSVLRYVYESGTKRKETAKPLPERQRRPRPQLRNQTRFEILERLHVLGTITLRALEFLSTGACPFYE